MSYHINHKQSVVRFICGHFENMQINPLSKVRFMETFSGTHRDLLKSTENNKTFWRNLLGVQSFIRLLTRLWHAVAAAATSKELPLSVNKNVLPFPKTLLHNQVQLLSSLVSSGALNSTHSLVSG